MYSYRHPKILVYKCYLYASKVIEFVLKMTSKKIFSSISRIYFICDTFSWVLYVLILESFIFFEQQYINVFLALCK